MRKYAISTSFYNKLKHSIEDEGEINEMQQKKLLRSLPKRLSNQVSIMLNKQLIGVNFFFSSKPVTFLTRAIEHLKQIYCMPTQLVVNKGDISDGIYFVINGEVILFDYYMSNKLVFETITECDYFGDIDVFLYDTYQYSGEATFHSQIMTIDKTELFKYVLADSPEITNELILEARQREDMIRESKIAAINKLISTNSHINSSKFQDKAKNYQYSEISASFVPRESIREVSKHMSTFAKKTLKASSNEEFYELCLRLSALKDSLSNYQKNKIIL